MKLPGLFRSVPAAMTLALHGVGAVAIEAPTAPETAAPTATATAQAATTPVASSPQASAEPLASWWDGRPWTEQDRGFFWYPDPARPKPKTEPEPVGPKPFESLKSLKDITAEYERLKEIAILEPTTQHLKDYMLFQNAMFNQSAQFADVFRRVNWQTPELDRNAVWPQANFASLQVRQTQYEDQDRIMRSLAATHGILFFYRSDCEYCHMQLPILQLLHAKYGIEILGIALDGKPIGGGMNWKPDNGISLTVTDGQGIQVTPTMVLISRDQKQVTMLGAGAMAMDDIVERVRVLTSTTPGKEFK